MTKLKLKAKPKEAFAIYSMNCLRCSHLVDGAKKAYVPCHFSKGNMECPALEVKVVPVGQAMRYAKSVLKARDKRDLEKEAHLLKRVASKSKEFQSRFSDILQSLTGAH